MRALIARFKSSKAQVREDNPHLCSKCVAIFDAWLDKNDWDKSRPRHTHCHIVGLQASARNGCPICVMFIRGLPHGAIEKLLQDQPSLKALVTVSVINKRWLYLVKLDFRSRKSGRESALETAVHVFPSINHDAAIGTIQEFADAEENWALIKKWLSICQEAHLHCRAGKPVDGQLPTRLIELGDSNMDLKLCRTKFLPPETRYLTLSHCWGGKVFTTLTRSNFTEFLSRIPTESLSKTFREAITITRKLGFKYLWIDSLCIIQKDEADWRYEAARMGSVYSNSTLNIAASAAPNGNFGCFTARSPGKIYGCKVTQRGIPGTFYPNNRIWDITIKYLQLELLDNVLDSRGWAFQESFLAPRTLYFTPHQLFFQCISTSACETFPDSFDDGSISRPGTKFRIWNEPKVTIDEKWSAIVSDYSGKDVTFRKDKLVALSGVARQFATKFETTYLAGMWKENLVVQLTWFTTEPSATDIQDSMPSWTWLAISTHVESARSIIFEEFVPLVSILEATTVVVDDEFGEVKEGTIRMRCRLPIMAGVVKEHDIQWFSMRLGMFSPPFKFALFPDRKRYSVGQELYFLPLIRGVAPWDNDIVLGTYTRPRGNLICGLVIEPAKARSYRRTGYFAGWGDDTVDFVLWCQKASSCKDRDFIGEASGFDEEGYQMGIITLK